MDKSAMDAALLFAAEEIERLALDAENAYLDSDDKNRSEAPHLALGQISDMLRQIRNRDRSELFKKCMTYTEGSKKSIHKDTAVNWIIACMLIMLRDLKLPYTESCRKISRFIGAKENWVKNHIFKKSELETFISDPKNRWLLQLSAYMVYENQSKYSDKKQAALAAVNDCVRIAKDRFQQDEPNGPFSECAVRNTTKKIDNYSFEYFEHMNPIGMWDKSNWGLG
ncbi:MAG: hypothetical protein AAF478_11155 [Pseudomonadota bacterium]